MKELKQQFVSALLVIFTVAAVLAAGINFQQQSRYHLPDDGVTWIDRITGDANHVVAVYVLAGSPAEKAGLQTGDVIVEFGGEPVATIDALHKLLTESRIGATTPLTAIRHADRLRLAIVPAESPARRRNRIGQARKGTSS